MLGFQPTRWPSAAPKRVPQTDAIFEQLKPVNPEADRADGHAADLHGCQGDRRLGPFSRRGRSRTETKAADHDFKPEATLTPFGIFLPRARRLWLYIPLEGDQRFHRGPAGAVVAGGPAAVPRVKRLVINLDNGPENHSRRTQFLKRMVEFARKYGCVVELAYYPPYHSKYNPIERCWGILERHWNGALLDSVGAAGGFARSMTWRESTPW